MKDVVTILSERRKNMRETIELKALRRLDILGMALSERGLEWTVEERRSYDYLVRFITKYAPDARSKP